MRPTDTDAPFAEADQGATGAQIRAEILLHLSARHAGDAAGWTARYLALVARALAAEGFEDAAVAPLREIGEDIVRRAHLPVPPAGGSEPETEYAKAAAEVSILILTGTEETEAAQQAARHLITRGIAPPSRGGDARGWKRLLIFRERVRNGLVSEDVAEAYRSELDRLKRERK